MYIIRTRASLTGRQFPGCPARYGCPAGFQSVAQTCPFRGPAFPRTSFPGLGHVTGMMGITQGPSPGSVMLQEQLLARVLHALLLGSHCNVKPAVEGKLQGRGNAKQVAESLTYGGIPQTGSPHFIPAALLLKQVNAHWERSAGAWEMQLGSHSVAIGGGVASIAGPVTRHASSPFQFAVGATPELRCHCCPEWLQQQGGGASGRACGGAGGTD